MIIAGQRVLIWGCGRHGGGLAAAQFAAAQGATVSILDSQPLTKLGADGQAALAAGWDHAVGNGSHPWLQSADVIIPSPAIPPRAWPAQHAPVCSPEALFFAHHRGPRIAVTGTKGKSTTAMLLGAVLDWPVGGNSNEPLLLVLQRQGPDTPIVCELSSFQLHYLARPSLQPPFLQQPPQFDAVVVTNILQDHLDWHDSLEHYVATKRQLLGWSPINISADPTCANQPLPVCFETTAQTFVTAAGSVVGQRSDVPLLGDHNAHNAALALSVATLRGIPTDIQRQRLQQVTALPHRLQLIHQRRWQWIDDSIATTPESSMAALAAIHGPVGLICGGADKGATWDHYAQAVQQRQAAVATIGRTGAAIASALEGIGASTAHVCDTLDRAVADLCARVPVGGTILLSPACSSLDQFTSFEARGRAFLTLAQQLDG